jgi:hypothetical protein
MQFPLGTKFKLTIWGPNELTIPVVQTLNEMAAERGFQVERPPPIQ